MALADDPNPPQGDPDVNNRVSPGWSGEDRTAFTEDEVLLDEESEDDEVLQDEEGEDDEMLQDEEGEDDVVLQDEEGKVFAVFQGAERIPWDFGDPDVNRVLLDCSPVDIGAFMEGEVLQGAVRLQGAEIIPWDFGDPDVNRVLLDCSPVDIGAFMEGEVLQDEDGGDWRAFIEGEVPQKGEDMVQAFGGAVGESSRPYRPLYQGANPTPSDFGNPDVNQVFPGWSGGDRGAFMEDEVPQKGEDMVQAFGGAVEESCRPDRYDVFLSFRGKDTRNGFAGHLHAALDQRGIVAFMDDEELREGEELGPAIFRAIDESRISIVVFSENYASSRWCLDELVRILECKDRIRQIVLPVFYKVDPSEVRYQGGRYEQALLHHEERLRSKGDSEKVKRWRKALATAANISGWPLIDKRESDVIKSIVEGVWAQLNRKQLHVPENVVAMDQHVDRIRALLDMESNEVRIVGICGLGGIGKTTIAKAAYNAFTHRFDSFSFLSNVRETCEKFGLEGGLLQLQEALISEVMWDDDLRLGNVPRGTSTIKRRLCKKKVLIFIDDVDQLIQLETLVGGLDWFGCGSRIIITTRDEHLLVAHGIEYLYKVQSLDVLSARRLFISIVFKKFPPPPGYEELSYNVVNYTKGLPLAIKILGSFLRGRSLLEWKSTLDKLKRVFNGEILSVLRISFDSLDDYTKDIFLDIACFFKGESVCKVKEILDSCDLCPDGGIAVLMDQLLITNEYGKLEMHDIVQEMGREIVRRESPKEPGERSRLWFYEDVLHVLTEGTGTNKVEAMMLKLAAPEEVCFHAQALTNMKRLRIFLFRNVHHSGDPIYFPAELRWLEWPDFSLPSVPFNTGHRKLVGLDLSKSIIRTLGTEFKLFRNMRSVDFSHCTVLSEISDVSSLPNLKRLDLQECTNLVEVHQSLGCLDKLVYLNFLNCCNLSCFPSSLKSRSLEDLILQGCSKLSRFPDILVPVKCLKTLALHETAIKELPSSIANLVELKELCLRDCADLKNLPRSIYTHCSILSVFLLMDAHNLASSQNVCWDQVIIPICFSR